MTERPAVLYSRRSILRFAVGLLAAGCATETQVTRSMRPAQGFPYPSPWCYHPSTARPLDELGRLIMRHRNPSCVLPGVPPCDATNTGTWPHQLTDETTWKTLTEFDFQPDSAAQPWQFVTAAPGVNALVTRSMRIPYLIKHTKAKKKKIAISVGRENLLVGFEPRTDPVSSPQAWGEPGVGCPNDSVGELARFITDNMTPGGHTETFFVQNWNVEQAGSLEPGTPNTTWYFRRAPILIDFSFRFPVGTRQGAVGAVSPGWIYVGYEGGGAY